MPKSAVRKRTPVAKVKKVVKRARKVVADPTQKKHQKREGYSVFN